MTDWSTLPLRKPPPPPPNTRRGGTPISIAGQVGLFAVTILVAVVIGLSARYAVDAQAERPAVPVRQWTLTTIPGIPVRTVRVVDTVGVCLYVVTSESHIAVAAVPKTQLPFGVGCQ